MLAGRLLTVFLALFQIVLSGFPLQNNLSELYAMLEFARPMEHPFGNLQEFVWRCVRFDAFCLMVIELTINVLLLLQVRASDQEVAAGLGGGSAQGLPPRLDPAEQTARTQVQLTPHR